MSRSPQKTAIALHYTGQGAPKVTAKGHGHMAEQIIKLAQQAGVPLMEDPQLAALLSQVELEQEIPPALYEAVVQVLIFAYEISGRTPPAYPKK